MLSRMFTFDSLKLIKFIYKQFKNERFNEETLLKKFTG